MSRRQQQLFDPLEILVTFLLGITMASLLLGATVAAGQLILTGHTSVSIATVGQDDACAAVRPGVVPSSFEMSQEAVRRDVGSVRPAQVVVCLNDPTLVQRLGSALDPAGDLMLALGSLFLLRRAIHAGRRGGPFAPSFASHVRQLGWFLLAMSVLWPVVSALGRGVVLTAAVPGASWVTALYEPGISVSLVVVALGVLTTARVLRRGILLQEEADQTV